MASSKMATYHSRPRIYGRRDSWRKAALLAIIITFAFAGLIATMTWLGFQNSRKSSPIPRSGAADQAETRHWSQTYRDKGMSSLQAILKGHLAAMPFADAQSLIISGQYETAGTNFDMEIQTKRPGLYRQVLSSDDLRFVHAFDGERTWKENPLVGKEGAVELLDELNHNILILECSYATLCWQYHTNGIDGLELVQDEAPLRNRTCAVIRNTSLLDFPTAHYIDLETGLEVRRLTEVTIGEKTFAIEINYRSPAFNEKEHNEAGYLLTINGRIIAEATFESQRSNPGLMSWMFHQRNTL